MLFAITNTDRPGVLELRMAARPDHLVYLDSKQSQIIHGGAILDAEGKPCGSMLIIEADSVDAARAFAAGDPYAKAGVFEASVVRPFREAYRDGKRL